MVYKRGTYSWSTPTEPLQNPNYQNRPSSSSSTRTSNASSSSSMAIFSSLIKTLTRNSNSRTFLTAATTTTISSPPFPSPPLSLFLSPHISLSHSRFSLTPLSKWFTPYPGPLFLSSPPWKLSQSATPLYLQGDVILLRKVKAINFLRTRSLPIRLKFAPISPVRELLPNRVDSKESNDGGNGGIGSFTESFVNLPNLVSMSRLVSGPVLAWMIINEWYTSAFLGLVISGATDWLDGYVARKMNINSVVGSYLDPLADKVLIGCVALAMVHNDLLHPGLVGLVVLRDVGLVGGAFYKRASDLGWEWKSWYDFFNLDGTSRQKVEPLFISKVNTVFQLLLVAGALLQPDFGTEETLSYITYLSWLVASTTVASTAAYGAQHMRTRSFLITKNH